MKEHKDRDLEEELNKMSEELKEFKREKEKVRAIVGQIGGVPTYQKKLMNILFIIFIVGTLIFSLFVTELWRYVLIDLAVAAISLKIIYLINNLERVNHFELWTIASIEWQINSIRKDLQELKKYMKVK